jgi:hypothetical protein
LRETLQTVERMTGRTPPGLDNPTEFPAELHSLWRHYMALRRSRPIGIGISPIPETEIRAYCTNRRMRFEHWELEVLQQLDDLDRDKAKKQ